jgi:phosphoglycolate phosphatase-like HAD superfamily hydrolase
MIKSLNFSGWLIQFIRTVNPDDAEWHRNKLNEIAARKRQKRVNDVQIEHDLELLKIQFAAELERTREREIRITQDYKEFLDNIDDMKMQIVEAFPDMPKALALLIHQHAKRLIDAMWNNPDEQTQKLYRTKLAEFLKVVFDDTTQTLLQDKKPRIPEKTLALLQ